MVMSTTQNNSRASAATQRMLAVIVALQALTLAGQWLGNAGPRILPSAQAQLANPAAERQAMLDEIKSTTEKLDRLIGSLQSGELQVRVVNPDDSKSKESGRGK